MKINKLLVVALLVGTTSFAQNLQSAIKNTDNELFTESEKELKALITKEPTNAANYYYLGENFYARKENDSALFYWNKAVSSDAVSHLGQISNGKIKLVSGDVVRGERYFYKLNYEYEE
jgi:predicted Zn-dependent protease